MATVDLTYPFLHQVRAPSTAHKLDFVFVHGLNPTGNPTHPYDTWTHPETGVCWPKQLLGDDVSSARIFLYGYNSNVRRADEVTDATITEHADNLLRQLVIMKRSANQSNVKIVFFGHSLGGLVTKQALLNAQRNPKYRWVLRSTFGMVFFAVPHRGANLGNMVSALVRAMSSGKADNKLLESLEKNSLFTQDMCDEYRHLLEDYRVVSFYERMKTQAVGCSVTVVGKESAVLGLSGAREEQVAVTDATHSSICKIAGRGNIYTLIVGTITEHIIDRAIEHVQSCVPPPSLPVRPTPEPPAAGSSNTYSTGVSTTPSPPPVIGALFLPDGTSPADLELAEHKNMGRWDNAIAIENNIFQERQRNLGADHPSTIQTACDLAYLFWLAERANDAALWVDWALSTSRRVLGNDHQLTLKAESLKSAVLYLRGEMEKAEEDCVNVFLRQQEQLGEDHPDTLETQRLLAEICDERGKKAEGWDRLFSWAQKVERSFGENHLRTHDAVLALFETKYPMTADQLQFHVVEPAMKRTLEALKRDIPAACSPNHPLALRCLRIWGIWQSHESVLAGTNPTEASDTLRRGLSASERALGVDHPETMKFVAYIALLFYKRNMWKDAAPLFEKYAKWFAERRGSTHPESLGTLKVLGQMYIASKDWPKAQIAYQRLAEVAHGHDSKLAQEADGFLAQLSLINRPSRNGGRGFFRF